ncbi:TolC family protein [Tenacibaculum sp. MEBiC06402]|uniref:TolC family protein n=1 Tax=unclassified Tenacibaculum TaxID=2635139 RepID=UPI003B9C3DC8
MGNRFQITILLFSFLQLINAQELQKGSIVNLAELTLDKSPIVQTNQLSILNAEGDYQIQKSLFDYQLTSGITTDRTVSNLYSFDPRTNALSEDLKANRFITSLGLQKRFRIGLIADWSVNYSMSKDNYQLDRFFRDVGANIGEHTVSSSFSLTQPLLRGSADVASALEESSLLDLESEKTNLNFRNSFEILQLADAYWQYVAAFQSLEIFRENELRVQRVLEITEELVKADKKPAGDLAQIQADLANQVRQTKAAEQQYYSAKLNLGRVIGLSESDSKALNDPNDQFPQVLASGYTNNINVQDYISLAIENRSDIEASLQTEEAIKTRLSLAENSKKPQLNLSGFVNYGGLNFGNGLNNALSTFTQNDGRSVGFGVRLNFQFALNNNNARGNYLKNKTLFENQQISNDNLRRNVSLNVSIAVNNLQNSVSILEKAEESLRYYRQVFDNEKEKFQNGLTTLLNLILFQERLTFAQLEYLQANQQFASAIVSLRYQTGTLLKKTNSKITTELFYTIPKK